MAQRLQGSSKSRPVTRDIAPLSLRAAFRPDSVNAEKRTVEVIWTTGARVLRGFYERFWEELSLDPKHVRMERLTSGRAPMLDSHSGYSLSGVLGVVESARLEKGQGVATIRFAKAEDDAEADKIFRKVADGILTNISVGYRVHKFEQVEGGEDKIPVYRATDWEPYEVSLVGLPADAGAGVRAAENGEAMPCEFVTREETTMTEEEKAKLAAEEATRAAEAAAKSASESAARAAAEAATKLERERATTIRTLVTRQKLEPSFADELVTKGATVEEARAAVLDKLATASEATRTEQHVRIEGGDVEAQKFQRGAAAWLLQKAAVSGSMERARAAAPKHAVLGDVELDPGEFRGMSLIDLARASLELGGVKTRGMDKMALVGLALTQRSTHGYNTTSDFATLLENTLHKTLLASYTLTADTWEKFCVRGTVADFRPHSRYRMGTFGRLDKLDEHGEFKNKSIPDAEKQSISASTRGNVIALSRQAIINDDMSVFSRLATMLGRAAKLSIEMDVYDLLALNAGMGPAMSDGNALFHATHSNINATGAALSTASVFADSVVMASQKDPSKNEILDLRPHCILVPKALGGDARVINEAQYDPDTANKLQKPNVSRGMFTYIIDTPRLSGTRRYLFTDPAVAPVLEVAFLDGQSEPILDVENGWRVDGVEWKVRLDYGVAAVDFRGAVTNAGV